MEFNSGYKGLITSFDMRTYGVMQEKFQAFLTLALDTKVNTAYPF